MKRKRWATERWRGIFPVLWLMHTVMQIIFLLFSCEETKGMRSPTQQVQAICDALTALCDWTNCHSDLYNREPFSLTLFSLSQLYVSTSLSNRNSKFVSLEKGKQADVFSFKRRVTMDCLKITCAGALWEILWHNPAVDEMKFNLY